MTTYKGRLTKEAAFDWIIKYHATVKYREFNVDGTKTSRPWWIAIAGWPHMNPWTGKTLRGAIGMFAYRHRKALADWRASG